MFLMLPGGFLRVFDCVLDVPDGVLADPNGFLMVSLMFLMVPGGVLDVPDGS